MVWLLGQVRAKDHATLLQRADDLVATLQHLLDLQRGARLYLGEDLFRCLELDLNEAPGATHVLHLLLQSNRVHRPQWADLTLGFRLSNAQDRALGCGVGLPKLQCVVELGVGKLRLQLLDVPQRLLCAASKKEVNLSVAPDGKPHIKPSGEGDDQRRMKPCSLVGAALHCHCQLIKPGFPIISGPWLLQACADAGFSRIGSCRLKPGKSRFALTVVQILQNPFDVLLGRREAKPLIGSPPVLGSRLGGVEIGIIREGDGEAVKLLGHDLHVVNLRGSGQSWWSCRWRSAHAFSMRRAMVPALFPPEALMMLWSFCMARSERLKETGTRLSFAFTSGLPSCSMIRRSKVSLMRLRAAMMRRWARVSLGILALRSGMLFVVMRSEERRVGKECR